MILDMKIKMIHRIIIALVAGVAFPFGFAPYGFYPIVCVALAVNFLIWAQATPRQAFVLGWLFGVGIFGAGVSWLHISIHQYGNVPFALAILLNVLFIMGMALFPAISAWLVNQFFAVAVGYRLLLCYPVVWVLVEWWRGWFLGGFPWLVAGYSQIDSPIVAIAPFLGVYGVSLGVTLISGVLAFIIYEKNKAALSAGIVVIIITTIVAGLGRIHWSENTGAPLRVALVQANIAQSVKWKPESLQMILEQHITLTRQHWDHDLIIWPETAIPMYYHRLKEQFFDMLATEAKQHNAGLLLGIPVFDASNSQYYNGVAAISENTSFYFKRHLVPFGEYFPFKALLQPVFDLLQIPLSDFSPGINQKPLLQVAKHWFGISICYEDAFGNEVRDALPEAEALINVSNDGWFGDSWAPHQHLQIAQMRALENERFLLRATNTGISAIIGAQGQILATAPQFQVSVVTGKVQLKKGLTPYARFGNGLIIGLLLIIIVVFASLQKKMKSKKAIVNKDIAGSEKNGITCG